MGDPTDPLLGTLVGGRYRITRRLGKGGMGAVYVAEQAPLGREVALKVLRPDLAGNDTAIERFKREAQVIGTLGHPHIVSVFDTGTADDGTLYIAMELLHGEDLAARLRRRGPLSWQKSAHVVEQIARALAGAHARGVIHRDLKPANVIMMNVDGADDFVKVVDFGIAKLVKESPAAAAAAAPSITGGGFVPGTPGYIAPEAITGGLGDEPRADLYSLGVTWFEMLTGRCPFVGDSAVGILLKQINDDPPRPRDVAALDLPAPLEELLMKLIDRDPARRPASASDLLGELAELRRDGDISSSQMPTQSAHPTRPAFGDTAPKRQSWHFAYAGAAAVVAVVAIVALNIDDDADTTTTNTTATAAAVYYPDPPKRIEAEPAPLAPAATVTEVPAAPEVATLSRVKEKKPSSKARTVEPPPSPPPVVAPQTTAAETAKPPPSADDVWRDAAVSVLSTCDEGCAKIIAGRLRSIDTKDMAPGARAGVNECVAKCRRR